MRRPMRIVVCLLLIMPIGARLGRAELRAVKGPGKLEIFVDQRPLATYVYGDPAVPRPYFRDVMATESIQVTRHHPPQAGDDQDHPHHTGFFFSFGDLNGIDFWHLDGACRHQSFEQDPVVDGDRLRFVVHNRYESLDGRVRYLEERVAHVIRRVSDGIRFECDRRLTALSPVRIGSKEEGGQAVRVATALAVSSGQGGEMIDSQGRRNGDAIWGKQADWVVYQGLVHDTHVGVQLMGHPQNPAPCWWHARDYGLLTANPFGPLNQANSARSLKSGESLRLRWAILVFVSNPPRSVSGEQSFQDYVNATQSTSSPAK